MAVVLTNCQHKTMFFPPPGFRGGKKTHVPESYKRKLINKAQLCLLVYPSACVFRTAFWILAVVTNTFDWLLES